MAMKIVAIWYGTVALHLVVDEHRVDNGADLVVFSANSMFTSATERAYYGLESIGRYDEIRTWPRGSAVCY